MKKIIWAILEKFGCKDALAMEVFNVAEQKTAAYVRHRLWRPR
jgi:hypothetical protein